MRRTVSILAIVITILSFTSVAADAKPNEWTTICNHVVQPGETIYCIGRAYGVHPWAIAGYNGLVNPGLIVPGQVLAIPNVYVPVPAGPTCTPQCPSTPGPSCASYHLVVAGDNLYRISLFYGVSMWRIAQTNGILNPNYIRAGDVLCIPIP